MITQESLSCMGEDCLPAYGRLILDALLGKRSHFLSIEEILASWQFIDNIMTCIEKRNLPLIVYKDGSNGPEEQYDLTKSDQLNWYDSDRL